MRRIISIHWPESSLILTCAKKKTATTNGGGDEEKKKEMDWAHLSLRKPRQCITNTRHSLIWKLQGRRARGRPRVTRRRETEAEMASAEKTRKELELKVKEVAQDRMVLRTFVGGLWFPGSLEAKKKKSFSKLSCFHLHCTNGMSHVGVSFS
ncbi:hypothetical protein ElyMa_006192200 [Elysia marginata]|uniref:Uncharacterized protein n=1 Tax=Elysia marginata TaxID=1093978 RepID=A0AAV4H224_9GAST|nr:hypothetical protein ElyMa_006192200 [Elysia marginata]